MTLKYWRALCCACSCVDVTSFSPGIRPTRRSCWLAALDFFWLDDPTLAGHPYYRNPTLKSTVRPTTLISSYTAREGALLDDFYQAADDSVETVALATGPPPAAAERAITMMPRRARKSSR